MAYVKTLQHLLQRHRRPGDLFFAIVFLLLSVYLLSQLGEQTKWSSRGKLLAQPGFWPAASLIGMCFFASLHLLGSVLSERVVGRREEITFWVRGLEYAAWFMVYVWVVPIIGYLPSTLILMPLLAFRVGYRDRKQLLGAAAIGFFIVLMFKTLLAVKIPGGLIYEWLPDALRSFMLINF